MSPDPAPDAAPPVRPRRFDRQLWLVVLVAACVVVPRAALVCLDQNESVDDDYHLRRGLLFWTRADMKLPMTNPPLGGAISALPMFVLGCDSRSAVNPRTVPPAELAPLGPQPEADDPNTPDERRTLARAGRRDVLYGQPLRPDTLLLAIGIWKAAVYVPFVALAFAWCRSLYGPAAGWMAAVLLIIEPNFAAFIHGPSLDVIGAETVVLACYAAWRYARARSIGWLIATATATALAMVTKHLALGLPFVLLAYVALDGWARGRPPAIAGVWRLRVRRLAMAGLVWAVAVWAFTGFNVSVPIDSGGAIPPPPADAPGWRQALYNVADAQLTRPLPAGTYVGSVACVLGYNASGHWGYLLGEHRVRGWWFYFPVVSTYKVPIGIALVMLLALLSLRWTKPTIDELGLLVPMLALVGMLLTTRINVGFRHALPAYAFALLLSSRAAAVTSPRWLRAAAWVGVAAAAVHGLSYHSGYRAYLNAPRSRAYLQINDSNVDWGQSIRPVAEWIDAHPEMVAGRTVYLRAIGDDRHLAAAWYVGRRAAFLGSTSPRPTSGLLIVSPVLVAGLYDRYQSYTALAAVEPTAVVARTMLVYDMDALVARGFTWPPLAEIQPFSDVPGQGPVEPAD